MTNKFTTQSKNINQETIDLADDKHQQRNNLFTKWTMQTLSCHSCVMLFDSQRMTSNINTVVWFGKHFFHVCFEMEKKRRERKTNYLSFLCLACKGRRNEKKSVLLLLLYPLEYMREWLKLWAEKIGLCPF